LPPHTSLFLFTDPATTQLYPLSLHDALPISSSSIQAAARRVRYALPRLRPGVAIPLRGESPLHAARRSLGEARRLASPSRRFARDRKSTRLNSSHVAISYAVFCLKKKTKRTK